MLVDTGDGPLLLLPSCAAAAAVYRYTTIYYTAATAAVDTRIHFVPGTRTLCILLYTLEAGTAVSLILRHLKCV